MELGKLKSKLFGTGDSSWHIPFISNLADLLKPKMYAEIGIYESETLNAVAKHSDEVVGVDINPSAKQYIRAKNAKFIHGTVDQLIEYLTSINAEIDLAFIDGDHRIESALRDFEGLDKHASKNALILFHDTWPTNPEDTEVGRCADSYLVPTLLKDRTNGAWSSITIPIFPGLTIAARSTQLPSWLQLR